MSVVYTDIFQRLYGLTGGHQTHISLACAEPGHGCFDLERRVIPSQRRADIQYRDGRCPQKTRPCLHNSNEKTILQSGLSTSNPFVILVLYPPILQPLTLTGQHMFVYKIWRLATKVFSI